MLAELGTRREERIRVSQPDPVCPAVPGLKLTVSVTVTHPGNGQPPQELLSTQLTPGRKITQSHELQ